MDKDIIRLTQVFCLMMYISGRISGVIILKDWCSNAPLLVDILCILASIIVPEIIGKIID